MTDATAAFFRELEARKEEPHAGEDQGNVALRARPEKGERAERWVVAVDKGAVTVSQDDRMSDCTVRTSGALFEGLITGEVNAMAAVLRATSWSRATASCCCASSGCSPAAAPALGDARRDERRAGQDPRRQHVRRQRRAGRHRGLAHRPDRAVLVRHPLPVDVGADRRRRAAQRRCRSTTCSTSRRGSSSCPGTGTVYVDAKLSVIRQRAVGDGFHEELDDPQPRRRRRST